MRYLALILVLFYTSARATNLGLELGVLGYKNNAGSDVFGLQLMPGGRVFLREFFTRSWIFKPSIGFFRRGEGTSETGVVQNVFEAGVVGQYVINPANQVRANAGLAARLDGILSQISALNASETTPLAFRVRMGPTVGVAYSISRGMTWVTDFELTLSLEKPVKPFAALTTGLSFTLD